MNDTGFIWSGGMRPSEFKSWRKAMRLSQKEAAQALGLKRRVVQYYEKGERDGEKVEVPKSVRLACFALAKGVIDYHGPGGEIRVDGHHDERPEKSS